MSEQKENPKLIEFNKLMGEVKREASVSECFYHNKSECKGKIKQAHSIQRNGRLTLLEKEVNGNHIIYSLSEIGALHNGMITPVGVAKASTFKGFCDYHDTFLFSKIENNPYDDSDEHNFLHSYRAFAFMYHNAKQAFRLRQSSKEIVQKINSLKPDGFTQGEDLQLEDFEVNRKELDKLIENKKYDGLQYLSYFKEDVICPIVCSTVINPPFFYSNKDFNNHNDQNIPYSDIMLTVMPDRGGTIIILSCFESDEKGGNFLNQLDSLSDTHLEKAVTSLIIAYVSNWYLAPDFWEILNPIQKEVLTKERLFHLRDNFLPFEQYRGFWHSKFNFFERKFGLKR